MDDKPYKMPSRILQSQFRNRMGLSRSYSFGAMLVLYGEIMNEDAFIKYQKHTDKTLTNKLSAWANVDEGWLIKEGTGNCALFYAREPLPLLTRLYNFIIEIIDLIKGWFNGSCKL